MKKRDIILRATGMLGAISVLVIGATFALSSFQAQLTNVTFASTTQNLKVSADCSTFTQQDTTPISITNIVEGQDYVSSNAKTFCLRDTYTQNLSVAVAADVSTAVSSGGVDLSKVMVRIVDVSNYNATTELTLQQLESGTQLNGVNGGAHLAANSGTDTFTINFKLLPGAVSGNSATFANFALTFTGTAV